MSARRGLQGALVTLAVAAVALVVPCGSRAEEGSGQESEGENAARVPRREITLRRALELAGERNPSVARARAEVAASEARMRKAWAAVIPSISAGMTYSHLDHPDEIDTSSMMGDTPASMVGDSEPIVVRRQDDLSGSLTVDVPLVNPAAWASIGVSDTALDVGELSAEQTREAVLYSTARAYYLASMSRALVDLQKEQVRSASHHLEVAEQKKAAGSGLRIDVLRARTDLEQARQDLEEARLSLETSCDTLGVLTGTGGLPLPAESPVLNRPRLDEERLEERAAKNRPDLALARKSVELSDEQLDAAWLSLLPSINGMWQGTHQFTEMAEMGDPDETRWSVMLILNKPIFDWAGYHEIGEWRAALESASHQLAEAEQAAGQELRQARREYLSALREVENAASQARLARETLRLATSAYDAGAGSSLEVTDARRTASAAEVNLVTARLKAQLSLLDVLQAAGEPADEIAAR
ncbi:MAG: TolC family protein [Polyangia bacterium]